MMMRIVAEAESGVRTKCIAIDFTGGAEIYEKIAEELSEIKEIEVLGEIIRSVSPWVT